MTKIIDEQTLRELDNTIAQCRDRLGQHAYTKRPLDAALQVQIAQALEMALRILRDLPAMQETP